MSESGKKVLVVEDNEVNRELMKDILEMQGYNVLLAGDGEEGVRIATEQLPDLILMDIQLPKMDGLKATEILRANTVTSGIPIVALTAFAMKGDEDIFIRAGMNAYISKPISVKSFVSTIKSYLG